MRVTSLALAVLLLAAVWTGAHCDTFLSQSSTCCLKDNFVPRRISPKYIKSCRLTGPTCSRRAVIVTLTRGKEVCVELQKIQLATCKRKTKNIP